MTQQRKLAVDPGQQYGIIGIIMLVIGLPFIGIFLSIIGYKKSKKVGINNTLAKVGIWLNALFMVVTVLLIAGIIVLLKFGVTAYDTKLRQAHTSAIAAAEVEKLIKSKANGGVYPDYGSIMKEYAGDELVPNKPTPGQVGYEECRTSTGVISGIRLWFADTSSEDLKGWDTYITTERAVIGVCNESTSDSWYTST